MQHLTHELGFNPGVPISANSPEMMRRYGTRQDGTSYAARALEQLRTQAPTRPQAPLSGLMEAQKAVEAAGGAYWFTELTVMSKAQEHFAAIDGELRLRFGHVDGPQ